MDTRLALGVQPLAIPDQSAPLHKALALNALMGQGELQGLQLEEGRRGLRRSAALDALAASSTSDEEYLAGLRKIDPSAALKLQADRLKSQKDQGDVNESNIKTKAQLAGAFTNMPPEQQAAQYPSFVKQWNALNVPGEKIIENEQWKPEFLPRLQMIAQAGMGAKDQAERGDYSRTGGGMPPAVPPAVAALQGQPIPTQPVDVPVNAVSALGGMNANDEHVANVRQMGNEMTAAGLTPSAAVQPTQEITGQGAAQTPETLRARAAQLRQQGTKAAADVAKDLDTSANQLEQRILQEQGLTQQKATAAENIRVREEAIAARKQNQGTQNKTLAGKYADDFRMEPNVKAYRTVKPLYNILTEASKVHDAAADLNMVYAIANMFDPGSVVREGEQVNVVRSGGLPSLVQQWIGNVNGGQQIPDNVRQMFLGQGKIRLQSYENEYRSTEKEYTDLSSRNGIDPRDVTRSSPLAPPEQAKSPTAGKIPPPSDRIPGNSYNTPKGKLKWTGTGWVQP